MQKHIFLIKTAWQFTNPLITTSENILRDRIETFRCAILSCLFAVLACAAFALADSAHAQHHHRKAPKAELGMSVAADAHGHLWAVGKETANDGQYVVLQTSADLGKSWSVPRRVLQQAEPVSAEGENRPKIAFGSKGEIYISYTKPLSKPFTGEIRLVRSIDGGKTFAPPITVHANRDVITHRFDSLIVDRAGRVYVAWIDKRDMHAAVARKRPYAGAALYYAVSDDSGASFRGDYKIADHSCECCRIALALNTDGKPVALWRHVYAPNVRDHALAQLAPDGRPAAPVRASFDEWRIDACPHHGPSLAYAADGTRHQVWFNVKDGEGSVFHAVADASGNLGKPVRLGSPQAAHADVAVLGDVVALAWKQFDGKATAILSRLSQDGGRTWEERELARTQGASDQPRLVTTGSGIVLVWNTQNDGIRTVVLNRGEQ